MHAAMCRAQPLGRFNVETRQLNCQLLNHQQFPRGTAQSFKTDGLDLAMYIYTHHTSSPEIITSYMPYPMLVAMVLRTRHRMYRVDNPRTRQK